MPASSLEIVRSCDLLSRVEPPGLRLLADMAKVQHFSREQVIFRQGQPCPGMFIVGSGVVRIYKLSPSGKEHVLHLAPPGATFAEVAAILGMPCPAWAQAVEDTTCALLPAGPFMTALRADHNLCLQLLASMAVRVKQFVGLLEDIVLRDALSRVAKYLLASKDAKGLVRLPGLKKHLASHLNLTSETLSRCLRQLADDGLIEQTSNSAIRVLDATAMADAAEGVFPKL